MCLFITLFCFRLGESCSHVAALLFKVGTAVCLWYTRRACTELPCYWNDFVKKVKPAPVHGIQFYKKSATKTVSQNRYSTPSIATDQEQKQLLDSLASCSWQPFRRTPFRWKATPELERLPYYLTSLYKPDYASMTPTQIHCEVEEILAHIDWCWGAIYRQEHCKSGSCLTWFMMRAARITASWAHSAHKARPPVCITCKRHLQW